MGPDVIEEQDRLYGRCAVCSKKKSRKTRYKCVKCNKFLCLEHVTAICSNCIEFPNNKCFEVS